MPAEDEVLAAAQAMCNNDGRGVKALDAIPVGQGYAISISVPKHPGMSDENWHTVVKDIGEKLQMIPGVTRVTLAIS